MAGEHYITLIELLTVAMFMASPWILISWSFQLREILRHYKGRPVVVAWISVLLLLLTSLGTAILSLIILKLAPISALSDSIPPSMVRYVPVATLVLPGFLACMVVTIAVFWVVDRVKSRPDNIGDGSRNC